MTDLLCTLLYWRVFQRRSASIDVTLLVLSKSPLTNRAALCWTISSLLISLVIYGSFATLPVRAWFFRYLSLGHSLPGIFRTFSTLVVSPPRCFSQLPVTYPWHSSVTFNPFCNVGILNVDFNWFLTCLDFKGFKHFSQFTWFSLRSPKQVHLWQ